MVDISSGWLAFGGETSLKTALADKMSVSRRVSCLLNALFNALLSNNGHLSIDYIICLLRWHHIIVARGQEAKKLGRTVSAIEHFL